MWEIQCNSFINKTGMIANVLETLILFSRFDSSSQKQSADAFVRVERKGKAVSYEIMRKQNNNFYP